MKLAALVLGIVVGVSAAGCGDNIDGTDGNQPPTLADVSATTAEDTPVSVTVMATDPDDDAVTFSFTGPAHGTVAQTGGTIIYTPDENFNGTDSVTVTVSDGDETATAMVSITVTPVNDVPVAGDDSVATGEDMVSTIAASTLLANDTDVDGNTLTVTAVGTPSQGTATLAGTTITYTPATNFAGSATFEYTISDGTATATATVTITVGGENDAPVAVDDTLTIDEDAVTMIGTATLLANDTDAESQTLSITAVSNATGGTATLAGTDVTFTPTANFTGTAGFDYTVSDGADFDTGHVTITVTPVNDAPVATAGTAMTNEDTPVIITLAGTDVDGDALTFAIATGPTAGTLGAITQVTATTATVTYTPAANSSADDSFSFTVNDGTASSAPATVTIDVVPQNDGPVAVAGSTQTNEDTAVVITLAGTDPEGDALTFAVVTGPATGTLGAITQLSATTASVTYTPAANSAADDSFTFRVNDGTTNSAPATVTIDVVPQNDAPVAAAGSTQTNEDTAVVITLAGTDIDGDALTFAVVTGPAAGTLGAITQLTPTTASVTYTPAANSTADDSFTFRVNDGTANSASATVTIDVVSQNDVPVAVAGSTQTNEDTAVVITLAGTDADGEPLTFAVVTGPSAGTLGAITQLSPTTASVTYTPAANSSVDDSFTFRVNDGTANSAPATVTIDVVPQNDAPVAVDDADLVERDTSLVRAGSVYTANDADVDAGTTLTVTGVSNATNGSVSLAAGVITFTPTSGFTGTAGFDYEVSDGTASDIGHVEVTVIETNTPVVAVDDPDTTDEDVALVRQASAYLANDVDPDPQTLTISAVHSAVNGTVGLVGTTITFTPAAEFSGTASFEYDVTDGLATDTALVTVTVTAVNDAPVAVDDSATVAEDSNVLVDVLANDTNDDGAVTIQSFTQGTNGVVAQVGSELRYTPAANFNGSDTFTYTVVDGGSLVDTALVSVTVTPVNDTPIAVDQTHSASENAPTTITLTGTDVDAGATLTFAIAEVPTDGTLGPITQVSATSATVVYTPDPDFVGDDIFSFTVNDGTATSAEGLVLVEVQNVIACGDGFLEGGEVCDDGNTTPGDGCSATCTVEQGWDCPFSPSICTTICGDNFVVAGQEECDDMNAIETDGCTTQCQRGVVCGATNTVLAAGDRFASDPFNATCYVSFDDDMTTFDDAQAACSAVGGHLASITNPNEQGIVASVHNTLQNPWIGGIDELVEGSFGWITGEAFTFTFWAANQPDGGDPEDCVNLFASSFAPNSQWNDTNCDFTGFVEGRICEIEPTTCGNGVVDAVGGETCDDGNAVGSDGCSATCTVEPGAVCSGTAPTTCAKVVINEIDYDQSSTDTAEFIELYNGGTAVADLANHFIVLANGSGTSPAEYRRVELSGTLAAGSYATVCPANSTAGNCGPFALPAGTTRFLFAASSDTIQNGSPDAVGLYIISGTTVTAVDVVSYEGTVSSAQLTSPMVSVAFSEGTGVPLASGEEGANVGLSTQRTPNGRDTQNNNADFALAIPTPGAATAPVVP